MKIIKHGTRFSVSLLFECPSCHCKFAEYKTRCERGLKTRGYFRVCPECGIRVYSTQEVPSDD